MKIHDVQQLSPEWFELRRGRPTASNFGRIITAKTLKFAAGADDYIAELIAEKYHLGPISYLGPTPSKAMLHGTSCEPEARHWYELETGVSVRQVGFVTTDDGRFGCSPDGLVGDDGCLEIKCPTGKTQVSYLMAGKVLPEEYRAQCHGHMIVTDRPWCDFLSYCPGLPRLLVRADRDKYTEALAAVLEEFDTRLKKGVELIERAA